MSKTARTFAVGYTILLALTIMHVYHYKPLFKQVKVTYAKYEGYKDIFPLRPPLCHNVLSNITNGKWIKKLKMVKGNSSEYKALLVREQELDVDLNDYRITRGMHTRLWRDDGKCGFKNTQSIPRESSEWRENVPGWCDPKSSKPCCSDEFNGICGNECDCPNCIDMRTLLHPETSEWTLSDDRCRLRNYTSRQACAVLNKFDKLYFVGDSFVRKMVRGLILTLRSDPTAGASLVNYDENNIIFCTGLDQFRFPRCVMPPGNVMDLLANKTSFCGEDTPLIAYLEYNDNTYAKKFLDIFKSLLGKQNTFIFVGNGNHDGCNARNTQARYFDPALKHLKKYYGEKYTDTWWPHIVFTYPDSAGLLMPTRFLRKTGKIKCEKFSNDMKLYLDKNNITYIDFHKVTSSLHSYDGTHYGAAVNLMKTQIILNYLDSI